MKKRILCLLSLSVILTVCLALFVGCAAEPAESEPSDRESGTQDEVTPTEKPTKEPETLDDTKFNIFFNKEYLCAFVLPANPTDTEQQVAQELKTLLKDLTGKEPSFINDGESIDGYATVVLIGNTKYDESRTMSTSLSKREAIVDVENNKLVIVFDDLSSGLGAVRTLMDELAENKKGEVRLLFSYKEIYKALPPMDEFPDIEGAEKVIDCGEGTTMKYFSNALVSEFEKYCDRIDMAGFQKLSGREEKGNHFATFTAEDGYAYIYYTEFSKEIRLITGPIEALALEDYSADTAETVQAYIASVPQIQQGEGYIFRLSDGRFIILDGGYNGGDRVYKALRNLVPKGEITIAAWFISHPHGDHYPAFIDFIRDHNYDKSITIERLIHNYAHYEMYNINGSASEDNAGVNVQELYSAIEQYMPDLPL